ncbi:sialate O-acetylesterase [Saccharophagus sp. K07]|uniref:sialate O-acetylesterase n=1 Tax=Saccharophagus sp. K07 TaxID=2283636 RepID=UPI001CA3708C|nr:sialate O-acetylesterase [Saccharophagus sp. K07]
MITFLRKLNLFFVSSLLLSAPAFADVRLPRLLSDGAILQREKPLEIWGWADEGEKVTVEFGGKTYTTTTKSGRWSVALPKQKAGGPHSIVVQGNNRIELQDVWFGDLWIAAGQSNIELPLRRVAQRYPEVIPNTNLPQVRQFSVPLIYSVDKVKEDYEQGSWKPAVPENLPEFSAVGFFFAEEIHQHTQVPIGILSIAVGGSPAQAWISEEALQKYPHYLAEANLFKDPDYLQKTIEKDKSSSDAWYKKSQDEDLGLKGEKAWHSVGTNTEDWPKFKVPGYFGEQNIEFKHGVVWLKKTFELTEAQAKQPNATLWLGTLVDGDETYINGARIGGIGYQYPPRIYPVPTGVLKAGKNILTIRLTSYSGNPGFTPDKTYALEIGDQKVDLQGEWQYKIGMHAEPMQPTTTLHYLPGSLFKAKLAPAFAFNIKGVLWYQGESNVQRSKSLHPIPQDLIPTTTSAEEYQTLFPDLIRDWRKQFKQGDFPFLFVQLPNFGPAQSEPGDSEWASLRQAAAAALQLKNTGMAVTLDIGEWNDIHPLNKKDVGHRLALTARKIAYSEKSLLAESPTVKSVKRKGNQLIVQFHNAGKELQVRGPSPQHVAIASDDKKFVWANAKIDGNRLIVWHDSIEKPTWVRYAWADNPEGANLFNSAGLPIGSLEIKANK